MSTQDLQTQVPDETAPPSTEPTKKKKASATGGKKKGAADKALSVKKASASEGGIQKPKRGGSNRLGMTPQGVRRLTQRGGHARIHTSIFKDATNFSEELVTKILSKAVALAIHERLKTVSTDHALKSLEYSGLRLFGYSDRPSLAVKKEASEEKPATA